MNVLSLFDGIGTTKLALDRAGIEVENYFSSEIFAPAVSVADYNFPGLIKNLGDVRNHFSWNLPKIDLIIGGSPCTDLSIAMKNRKGLQGNGSSLFYQFVECLEQFKPRYFILENNASMKQTDRDKISEILGVQPIMINSSLVSGQNRKRFYWTNIKGVMPPSDKGITLADIIESGTTDRDKSLCVTSSYDGFIGTQDYFRHRYFGKSFGQIVFEDEADPEEQKNAYKKFGKYSGVQVKGRLRELSPLECERLQTLPDNYTKFGIFQGQIKEIPKYLRYKIIGSAFTADIICHILGYIKNRVISIDDPLKIKLSFV